LISAHTDGGIDGFDPEAVAYIRLARAILLQDAPERYSETLREFDRDPDKDERGQHLADKFCVQEVLQRDS
jgi:hypothetical protein